MDAAQGKGGGLMSASLQNLRTIIASPCGISASRPSNRLEHRMRPENQQRQIVNAKVDVEQSSFLVVLRRSFDEQRFSFCHDNSPIAARGIAARGSESSKAINALNALVTKDFAPLPLSSAPRGVA